MSTWAEELLAALLGGALLFGAGWTLSAKHSAKAQLIKDQAAEIHVSKVEMKQAAVSPAVEAKVVEKIRTIYVKGNDIIKEIPKYVPSSTCSLPGSFRVWHDAATVGEIPNPSAVADAASVPAQDLANTISTNYIGCKVNEQQVLGWQEWATKQRSINPPESEAP